MASQSASEPLVKETGEKHHPGRFNFSQKIPVTTHSVHGGIEDDFMYGTNVASSHIYVRMGFLRKVYGILSAQLLFTTIVAAMFVAFEPIGTFVRQSQWLVLLSVFTSFGLIIALSVKSRETPLNYILLTAFTFCEAILVGTIVTFYEVHSVVQAFFLTLAVTTGLTIYTFQSKRDFTSLGAGLFACLWILILAGIMQMFLQSEVMDLAISVGGAVLFSLFIIFDTYMIMHKVSPEDYIHASVNLYLDIINLFLHILRLIGDRR